MTNLRPDSITGLIFLVLLAAIFAHIWFASSPLPFGGPNVILAGVAVLLSLAYVLLRVAQLGERSAVISTLVEDFRPIIPAMAVSLLLTTWALAVYLFTDTLDWTRLAQMALGIGVLFAVYVSVDSVRRAKWVVMAVIVATFVSALCGIAVAFIGDPFLTVWLHIVPVVRERDINTIFSQGRIARLAAYPSVFAYQLAAGIPLAFAALLCNPFGRGKVSRRIYDAALFVILMTMVTVMVGNATRAAILGVLVGALIITLPSLKVPHFRQRLFFIVPLMAVWLLAFLNPVFIGGNIPGSVSSLSSGSEGPGSRGPTAVIPNPTSSDGHPLIGHVVEGLTPSKKFSAQVAGNDGSKIGETVVVTTCDDGSLTLVWRKPEGHTSSSRYKFRLRRDGEPKWGPWLDFCFPGRCSYMSSEGPLIHDLAAGVANGSVERTISHRIEGLASGVEYRVQIRARNEYGYGAQSEIAGAAAGDGSLALTWREPRDSASITAYQLRLRPFGETEWRPWRDFVPSLSSGQRTESGAAEEPIAMDRKIAMVRKYFDLSDRDVGANTSRLFSVSDWSAQSRIYMALMALRYSLDYPLGTGAYRPDESHVVGNLDSDAVEFILSMWPHNQFLYMLVLFGFPGLILLILFYVLVLRSLIHSGRSILRSQEVDLYFLVASVIGALAAYSFVSLTVPLGPFIVDWSHFFIVGLVFSIQRTAASHKAVGAAGQTGGYRGSGRLARTRP